MSARTTSRVVAAFAVVYVVWGSTYLAIRYAVETLPPFLMAGSRFVLAGLALYAWARVRGVAAPDARAWRAALFVGGLFVPLGNGLVVWAEQWVPSAQAALVAAGIPLWVALFERLAPGGKPLTRVKVVGLLVGFAGVVVLLGTDAIAFTGGARLVAVAVASMASALGMVALRRAALPADPAMSSAMTMLTGGAIALSVGGVSGEALEFTLNRVSAASAAAYAYLVVFGSILAFTCFAWLARTVSPSRASTHAYVNPLVALALGAWLGGETIPPRALAAAPLVLVGLVLVLGEGTFARPFRVWYAHACASLAGRGTLRPRERADRLPDRAAAVPLAGCDRAGAG
ncbi:MAG TPA: EamA family transporter [Gemmatimonadales bacterium]|nr:EamA family transporter [Gemmatimonadales bacterium]